MDTTQITRRGRLFAGLFLLVIVGFASQTQAVQHLNTGSMMGKKMSTQSSVHSVNNNNHGGRRTLFGQLEARQMDKDKLVQLKQEEAVVSVSQGEAPSIQSDSTQSLDAGVVIPASLDAPKSFYESVSTSAEAPIEVTSSAPVPETSQTDTTIDLKAADNLPIEEAVDNSDVSVIPNLIPDTVIESAASAVLQATGALKDQILQNHKGLKDMIDDYNEDDIFGNQVDLQGGYQDTLDQQIQQKLSKKAGSLETALPLGNLFDKIEQEGFGLRSAHLDPLFIKASNNRHFSDADPDDEYDYIEEEVEVEDESGVTAQEPQTVQNKSEAAGPDSADSSTSAK